jgi:Family of unknown function (DUF5681)
VPKRGGSKTHRHAVGYGRPPKKTQFKPGRSGNPRGRPKGPRSIGAILREAIGQKIPVAEGGKTRRLPALEVLFRRLVNEALRSDPKAIKLLLSLVERYAESTELEPQLEELLADDQAILRQFLKGAKSPGH